MISSFLFNLYLYRVFVCLTSAVVVHHQIKLFCIDDDDDVIGIFFLLLRCYDLCHYFVCVFEMQQVFFFVICLIFDFFLCYYLAKYDINEPIILSFFRFINFQHRKTWKKTTTDEKNHWKQLKRNPNVMLNFHSVFRKKNQHKNR